MMRTAAQRDALTADKPIPFDTCVVLYNPNSTGAAQTKQRIELLRKSFPVDAVTVINTSPDGREANRQLLRNHAGLLGNHTLLAIAGGDGTVNLAVDALLNDPSFSNTQRQTAILPLWGGNGNDLAYMLNGAPTRLPLSKLLQVGRNVAVRPLSCEITVDGMANSHIAICYASFGASAYAVQQIEEHWRGSRPFFHALGLARFMHEFSMVLRALGHASRFLVEDDSATHTVYDRYFLNGSRLAKLNRGPLELTKPQFYYITIEQKRASSVAFHMADLRRHPDHYVVPSKDSVRFILQEPTWAQIDGEVMRLVAGTQVHIGLNEQPFYAFSTLLA